MKIILVTGGDGRLAKELKKYKSNFKLIFCSKKKLNISSIRSIRKNIEKYKPDYLFHLAGLSRPMIMHEKNISKSINLNIIGTCNVVTECARKKIKLIYISSNYIYPGLRGNYKETDPVLPWNNYGRSKLGGECAVQMYSNSLILRCALTEYPFKHKFAFSNVKNNFLYHKDFLPILFKVLSKKGILNIGGKTQTVYNFARKNNKFIKKNKSHGQIPTRIDMNLKKLTRILKNEDFKN